LFGSTLWLDQSIQLKQYTLDVFLALIPFLLTDESLDRLFSTGERRTARLLPISLLMLPAVASYTYVFAVGARLTGWYVWRKRQDRAHRLARSAAIVALVSLALLMAVLWFTDLRFNAMDRHAYLSYWNDCILSSVAARSPAKAVRLVAKFLWGWHSRQPVVTGVMVPLQVAGAWSVIQGWRSRRNNGWGSRSASSILLLGAVIAASAAGVYPICAGRVTLFCEAHLQLLAIEGAILLGRLPRPRAVVCVALTAIEVVFLIFGATRYIEFLRTKPEEDLTPIVSLIDPSIAKMAIVHPCSIAQIRSLPRPLPVNLVLTSADSGKVTPAPQHGERYWVIWSHLGADY